MNNIFTYFLSLLRVKHTKIFSKNIFEEHPHKYNLFGLSKMLSDYRVDNLGIKVKNKDDILELEAPFIAYTGVDFVVIKKVTSERVYYVWDSKDFNLTLDEFKKMWTGLHCWQNPIKIQQNLIISQTEGLSYFKKLNNICCLVLYF